MSEPSASELVDKIQKGGNVWHAAVLAARVEQVLARLRTVRELKGQHPVLEASRGLAGALERLLNGDEP
jgi:hypothetical protein